eukprot:10145552-Heterocapsa_arctica.AAC.1
MGKIQGDGPGIYGSGGLVIAVRDIFGIRWPTDAPGVIVPGRALEAIVDLPGMPPIHFISIYGYTGEGMSTNNIEFLAKVGQRCELRKGGL